MPPPEFNRLSCRFQQQRPAPIGAKSWSGKQSRRSGWRANLEYPDDLGKDELCAALGALPRPVGVDGDRLGLAPSRERGSTDALGYGQAVAGRLKELHLAGYVH